MGSDSGARRVPQHRWLETISPARVESRFGCRSRTGTHRREKMTFEIIQPDGMPAPSGFSYAVAASGRNMLFIAGQTAQDTSGNIVGSRDIVHQFECALDNVLRVL